MKSLTTALLWAGLFAVSLSVGWFVSRPSSNQSAGQPEKQLGEGKVLYLVHCARCHGADGRGDPAMIAALKPPPRDFRERPWKHAITAKSIRTIVLNGIAGTAMLPHRDFITESQADAIAQFVLTLSVDAATTAAEPPSHQVAASEGFNWASSTSTLPSTTLIGSDGRQLQLPSTEVPLALIHFWSTTCVHCLAEMAEIETRSRQNSLPFPVISVCVDTTDIEAAKSVAAPFAPGHLVYVDIKGLIGQQLGVSALPAYRLISRDQIVASHVGSLDWKEFDWQAFQQRAIKHQR